MKNGIFISYRHRDTQGEASRLADDLRDALADVQVFRDVETIEAGANFAQQLERALTSCSVLLVLIGPTWLEQRDAQGNRRIDDPSDWTRTEIATGLKRGIRVIPVKCRDAKLPRAHELPEDIRELVARQAFELDNNRWRYDLDRLVDQLVAGGFKRRERINPMPPPLSPSSPTAPPARRKFRWGWVAAAVFGAYLFYYFADEFGAFDDPADVQAQNEAFARLLQQGLAQNSAAPVAQAPAPAVQAPPVAPVAASTSIRNIAGTWRAGDNPNETYQFQQSGRDVTMTIHAHGVPMGQGQGTLSGDRLQLGATVSMSGVGVNMQCDLMLAANARNLSGTCFGPLGAFPTTIIR